MSKHERASAASRQRGGARALLTSLLLCALALAAGCTWDQLNPFKPPPPPPPPVDSFVLRNGTLVAEASPTEKTPEANLAGAREYYRREDYDHAQKLYHYLAKNEKNPASVVQEALYYEAECMRIRGNLPDAADTYANLLKNHTMNPYRDLAIQHIYEIATFWLQDTWEEVRESQERREGKRWVVVPRFIAFDKRKPFLDREGRALERLKEVSTYEGKGGPYADKALYLCGYVDWFNEDFTDADQDFTTLQEQFPDSPFAPYAVELAIKAKLMSTGGESYDGQNVAQARKLVDKAMRMPEMSEEKKQSLAKLLKCINAHQAEKDYQMAEFWRRTGHPGSAYFYYEIVRRRYPSTDAAARATQRMLEIRAKMEKDQRDKLGPPPEVETRPSEMLPLPQRVPPGGGAPEQAPMPQKVPDYSEPAPQPRRLPGGMGQN